MDDKGKLHWFTTAEEAEKQGYIPVPVDKVEGLRRASVGDRRAWFYERLKELPEEERRRIKNARKRARKKHR